MADSDSYLPYAICDQLKRGGTAGAALSSPGGMRALLFAGSWKLALVVSEPKSLTPCEVCLGLNRLHLTFEWRMIHMYCKNCGKQLSEDSRFCPYCGNPIRLDTQARSEEFWETCEVDRKAGKNNDVCFCAYGIGKSGRFVVGESTHWKMRADGGLFRGVISAYTLGIVSDGNAKEEANERARLNELIAKLIDDGWQPVSDRGRYWWQLRFRRRIS
jgi:hypothetical protein